MTSQTQTQKIPVKTKEIYLKKELNNKKKLIFGHKHERFIPSNHNPQQLSLELNVEPIAEKPAPVIEKITYSRQKQNKNNITPHGRQPLPEHLRKEEIVIQTQEDISNAKKIGEEITEILNIVYEMFNTDKIKLLACRAHVRRKFDEAKNNHYALAEEALMLIQQLYSIEQKAREEQMTFEQRKELRQLEALPILKNLEAWLLTYSPTIVPKCSLGQAIAYALGQWKKLIRYVDDGNCEIDNNLIEKSIRPVALGRKNYLFAGSHEAAQRIAMMYSFMGTCKINNINPFNWLLDVLTNINDCKISQLPQFLPPHTKIQ